MSRVTLHVEEVRWGSLTACALMERAHDPAAARRESRSSPRNKSRRRHCLTRDTQRDCLNAWDTLDGAVRDAGPQRGGSYPSYGKGSSCCNHVVRDGEPRLGGSLRCSPPCPQHAPAVHSYSTARPLTASPCSRHAAAVHSRFTAGRPLPARAIADGRALT